MAYEPKIVQKQTHCEPQEPPPSTDDQHECEGRLEGTITGKVYMDCCCARLHSRTFNVNIGPQTEDQMGAFVVGTANAWEAAGYVVLGHSLTDTGAGWRLFLTVGWYA